MIPFSAINESAFMDDATLPHIVEWEDSAISKELGDSVILDGYVYYLYSYTIDGLDYENIGRVSLDGEVDESIYTTREASNTKPTEFDKAYELY